MGGGTLLLLFASGAAPYAAPAGALDPLWLLLLGPIAVSPSGLLFLRTPAGNPAGMRAPQ